MTSLTTMFIVGKDEYVEFNETMGSKAFLQHVWDQSQTPLESRDVDAGHLHSTGARISKSSPPHIEFPTVLRVKGKGNTYRASGRYISWDELARLNPLAVKPPPSLEDFQARGGQVGSGPRLKPGELLRRDEPMAKIKKQASLARQHATESGSNNTYAEEDGWIGGSSESIYATTHPLSSPSSERNKEKEKPNGPAAPETPERKPKQSSSATKSRSLLERLGMDEVTTPPSKSSDSSPLRTTPSPGIRRPGAKIPSPLPLTSPARIGGPISPGTTRTPLSASYPVPETPLKLTNRGGPQTPATPHHPLYSYAAMGGEDAARASGLGLGLTPHKPTIPLSHRGSPEARQGSLHESPTTGLQSGDGSPYHVPPLSGAPATPSAALPSAGNQIEAMLEKLRKARSGLGTEASMWAPKTSISTVSASAGPSEPSGSRRARRGAAGVAAACDKLSTAMGSGRNGEAASPVGGKRRPGHRHNGLQLSLGQGIEVMQNLDEKAEEDETIGPEARQAQVPMDGVEDTNEWLGSVVPPTPALGADSPQFEVPTGANRGGSSALWGTVDASPEVSRLSLLSSRPNASSPNGGIEPELWSGDEEEMLVSNKGDRPRAAKVDRRNPLAKMQRAPPPSLNYKTKTGSPTYDQLDTFGVQDSSKLSPSLSALGAQKSRDGSRSPSLRLSPSSMPSPLIEDDSDGDADVEDDLERASYSSRRSKTSTNDRSQERIDTAGISTAANTTQKKSGRRDAAERKRGRRVSQTKEFECEALISAPHDAKQLDATAQPDPDSRDQDAPTAQIDGGATASDPTDALELSARPASVHGRPAPESDARDAAFPQAKELAIAPASSTNGTAAGHGGDPIEPALGTSLDASTKVEALSTEIEEQERSDNTVSAAGSQTGRPEATPASQVPEKESVMPASEEAEAGNPGSKPIPQSESGFDWAADEDDIDDALPDLDDWGITVPTTTSTTSITQADSSPATASKAHSSERRFKAARDRPATDAGEDASAASAWTRKDRSVAAAEPRKAPEAPKGPLGIRIAGCAASAAAAAQPVTEIVDASSSPRKELLQGTKFSMHAPKGSEAPATSKPQRATPSTDMPPPAATPYGRWKSSGAHANGQTPRQRASPAALSEQTNGREMGITIKGSGKRHAPPVSPTSATAPVRAGGGGGGGTSAASAIASSRPGSVQVEPTAPRRERPAVRPRVAADSSAFARLVGAVSSSAAANLSSAVSAASATPAPAAASGALQPGKKDAGAAGSMHAPSKAAEDVAAKSTKSQSSRRPSAENNETPSTLEAAADGKSPRMPNGFEQHNGRRKSKDSRSSSNGHGHGGRGGGKGARGGKKNRT